MAAELLHFVYKYYQFEGIPPYPSKFIPIDFYFSNWMAVADIFRSRTEKHYVTSNFTPGSGLEHYTVSVGSGRRFLHRRYWNGGLFREIKSQAAGELISVAEWLDKKAAGNQLYIQEARSADPSSVREELDDIYGPVQIVTALRKVQASDLYLEMPLEIEQSFDLSEMRLIERSEVILLPDGSRLLHRSYRLIQWRYLQPDEIPPNLFDFESIIGLGDDLH